MASVIGIRAHRPTEAVARLHGEVSRALPDVHVVVVADQMRGAVAQPWPTSYDMIPITDEFLRSAGLRTDLVDAGWRCGDYAHYVLHQALDPDHAWLVEPDVRFLGMDLGAFLGGLDMSTADLVAADLLPAPDWLWSHQLTSRGVETPWRCFFPLTRLSRAAVGASLELRLRLQGIDNHFGQPNDEGIVATAVMTAGLTAADLRLLEPDAFTHFHHRPRLHHDVVAAHSPARACCIPASAPLSSPDPSGANACAPSGMTCAKAPRGVGADPFEPWRPWATSPSSPTTRRLSTDSSSESQTCSRGTTVNRTAGTSSRGFPSTRARSSR